MKLLASMVGANLRPDSVTVTELISSLSGRGRWDEAKQVLEIAEHTGAIAPSTLDGEFEVDVSSLPSAIAKVKVGRWLNFFLQSVPVGGHALAGIVTLPTYDQ